MQLCQKVLNLVKKRKCRCGGEIHCNANYCFLCCHTPETLISCTGDFIVITWLFWICNTKERKKYAECNITVAHSVFRSIVKSDTCADICQTGLFKSTGQPFNLNSKITRFTCQSFDTSFEV